MSSEETHPQEHGAETLAEPERVFQVDQLTVQVFQRPSDLARAAASEAASHIAAAISRRGQARVILATGNSQIHFLEVLSVRRDLDWAKVDLFHMDEYLGISRDHPSSFRRYLSERVEKKLAPRSFHYLEGDALLPLDECRRYEALLKAAPIDLCCLGVGENGHIAFNDPSVADFDDPDWVKLVKLDDHCKRQQVNEGHFPDLAAVPSYAFTLTIPALCHAEKMLCMAPEERKADAIHGALKGKISAACPASALRRQPQCTLLLDPRSASRL